MVHFKAWIAGIVVDTFNIFTDDLVDDFFNIFYYDRPISSCACGSCKFLRSNALLNQTAVYRHKFVCVQIGHKCRLCIKRVIERSWISVEYFIKYQRIQS